MGAFSGRTCFGRRGGRRAFFNNEIVPEIGVKNHGRVLRRIDIFIFIWNGVSKEEISLNSLEAQNWGSEVEQIALDAID